MASHRAHVRGDIVRIHNTNGLLLNLGQVEQLTIELIDFVGFQRDLGVGAGNVAHDGFPAGGQASQPFLRLSLTCRLNKLSRVVQCLTLLLSDAYLRHTFFKRPRRHLASHVGRPRCRDAV
ncbi:hypothetical protein H310_03692 [Aphanomyces invadans]|uniref:Uncharacterized protein n=1 Tax=Aphanomyces invadans TaxID=157072 RepID=A0A024UKF2_9STRA|nr:hypothetical protein H310_03692 [Aphanomyces invadans]ETW06098.1 hypothetical protein H310_03692 [Aphanomyces invadans]|eukprot:XP_008865875.1 hypothetical protein H310_03692 [Aphanomyces invadans]